MFKKINSALVGIAFLAMAGTAEATPLNYDEASDGDIDIFTNLVLGFGANTIMGTVACPPNPSNPSGPPICDFDFFDTTLPSGAILVSIDLELTLADGGSGEWADRFQWWVNGVYDYIVVDGGGFFSVPFDLLDPTAIDIGLNDFPKGFANDYFITINIANSSAIPEPATLALFSFGLVGLAVMRRRRKLAI